MTEYRWPCASVKPLPQFSTNPLELFEMESRIGRYFDEWVCDSFSHDDKNNHIEKIIIRLMVIGDHFTDSENLCEKMLIIKSILMA
jgi:hypothetical protein